jgi:hypothetical protein
MIRIFNHLRANVVAYIALFIALGGSSYAAVAIGDNTIDPVKLNPRYIGGYVAAWAQVRANGRVISASPFSPRVDQLGCGGGSPGACQYTLIWRGFRPNGSCTALATVQVPNTIESSSQGGTIYSPYGFATAYSIKGRHREKVTEVVVFNFNSQGQPAAMPVNVGLICRPPR